MLLKNTRTRQCHSSLQERVTESAELFSAVDIKSDWWQAESRHMPWRNAFSEGGMLLSRLSPFWPQRVMTARQKWRHSVLLLPGTQSRVERHKRCWFLAALWTECTKMQRMDWYGWTGSFRCIGKGWGALFSPLLTDRECWTLQRNLPKMMLTTALKSLMASLHRMKKGLGWHGALSPWEEHACHFIRWGRKGSFKEWTMEEHCWIVFSTL